MIVRFAQEATERVPPSAIISNVQSDTAATRPLSVVDRAQDSATTLPAPQGATSMPPRMGPPDTSNYMKLGYVAAAVIFLAYIALLLKRVANVRRPH